MRPIPGALITVASPACLLGGTPFGLRLTGPFTCPLPASFPPAGSSLKADWQATSPDHSPFMVDSRIQAGPGGVNNGLNAPRVCACQPMADPRRARADAEPPVNEGADRGSAGCRDGRTSGVGGFLKGAKRCGAMPRRNRTARNRTTRQAPSPATMVVGPRHGCWAAGPVSGRFRQVPERGSEPTGAVDQCPHRPLRWPNTGERQAQIRT